MLRLYGIAIGVALGQLGPTLATPPGPRPPIIRTRTEDRDAFGFDQRERLGGMVLTTPLAAGPTVGPPGATGIARHDEPGWVRAN